MSVLWSSSSLKKLVNACSSKEWKASGVEIDSRKVKKGDLFCAINGKNYNGVILLTPLLKVELLHA